MIYDAEDLSKQVYEAIKYYQSSYITALQEASKTKEQVKLEVTNSYEEENKQLKDTISRAVAVLNSEKELEDYNKFYEEHRQKCMNTKATSGKLPYVKQLAHGLGVITKVYCQVCGEYEDITDTSVW